MDKPRSGGPGPGPASAGPGSHIPPEDGRPGGDRLPPQPLERQRDRPYWGRPLGLGLGLSGLAHAVAILLYSFSAPPGVGEFRLPAATPTDRSILAGTRVLNVVAVEGEPEQPAPEPEQPVEESDEPEVVAPAPPGPAPDDPSDPELTAAEVLRPNAEDSVLTRGVDPELLRLTPAERAQARIDARAADWNALMDAERRAAEDALDWTYTDDEGNRWGVSPGQLHLGGVTLPLPLNFSRPPGVDPAQDRLERDLAEIDLQEGRSRVWQSWKERAAEIRKRKDRERAEARGASPPDTLISR